MVWKKAETDKWTSKSKAGKARREKLLQRFAPSNRKVKEELSAAAGEATAALAMAYEDRLETFEFEYHPSKAINAKGLDEVCYVPKKKKDSSSSAWSSSSTTKKPTKVASKTSTETTKKRKLEGRDGDSPCQKIASAKKLSSTKPSSTAGVPTSTTMVAMTTTTTTTATAATTTAASVAAEKPRKSLADMLSFDVTSALTEAYQSKAPCQPVEVTKTNDEDEDDVAKKRRKLEETPPPRNRDIIPPCGNGKGAEESARDSGDTSSRKPFPAIENDVSEPRGSDHDHDHDDVDDDDDKISTASSLESRRPPSLKPTSPDRDSVSSRGGRRREGEGSREGGGGGSGRSGGGGSGEGRGRDQQRRIRSSSRTSSSLGDPLSVDVRESSASRDVDYDESSSDVNGESTDGFSDFSTLSPKTENDLFRQFCLCHFAEMNLKLPWLNKAQVKTMLKDHWKTLSVDERMWYVYNFLTPQGLIPAVVVPRPPNRLLEKLVSRSKESADEKGDQKLRRHQQKTFRQHPHYPRQQQSGRSTAENNITPSNDGVAVIRSKTALDDSIESPRSRLTPKTVVWEIEKLSSNPSSQKG